MASQEEEGNDTEVNETPAWRQLEESPEPDKRIPRRVSGRMVPVGQDGFRVKDDYK